MTPSTSKSPKPPVNRPSSRERRSRAIQPSKFNGTIEQSIERTSPAKDHPHLLVSEVSGRSSAATVDGYNVNEPKSSPWAVLSLNPSPHSPAPHSTMPSPSRALKRSRSASSFDSMASSAGCRWPPPQWHHYGPGHVPYPSPAPSALSPYAPPDELEPLAMDTWSLSERSPSPLSMPGVVATPVVSPAPVSTWPSPWTDDFGGLDSSFYPSPAASDYETARSNPSSVGSSSVPSSPETDSDAMMLCSTYPLLGAAHSSPSGAPALTDSELRIGIPFHPVSPFWGDTTQTSPQQEVGSQFPAYPVSRSHYPFPIDISTSSSPIDHTGAHGDDSLRPSALRPSTALALIPSSKGKHHDHVSSSPASESTAPPTDLVALNAPLDGSQSVSNSEGQTSEEVSPEKRRQEVITQLAATTLDTESTRHRIGCHLLQLFDIIEELVDLDKKQQLLTDEFCAGDLDGRSQRLLSHSLRCRRMAARNAFPRLPASRSLSRYSDQEIKRLGRNFSVNPASVEPQIKRLWAS